MGAISLPNWIRRLRRHPPNSGGSAQSLIRQGNDLLAQGKLSEAATQYEAALVADCSSASACVNLGFVLKDLGKTSQAQEYLERALQIEPGQVDAHFLLGSLAEMHGELHKAFEHFYQAIALNPSFSTARSTLSRLLLSAGRREESKAIAESGLVLDPQSANLLFDRGNVHLDEHSWQLAVDDYDKALAVEPDFAEAYSHRGIALHHLGRFEEALSSFDSAIQIQPNFAVAYSNRGLTLSQSGRIQEAIDDYEKAIALAPDFAEAHWNNSLNQLLLGNFEDGWPEFEWRWKQGELKTVVRDFRQPRWTGEQDIRGKRVFLYAEQGLGDAIQFCRYSKRVAELGANVILEVPAALTFLLRDLKGTSLLVNAGDDLPEFDFQCPLLSLPMALKEDIGSISGAPYLRASQETVAAWSTRLGRRARPRVGLVWSGSYSHKNDINRSIPLARFTELLIPEIDYFCLQKEIRMCDRAALSGFGEITILECDLNDFADTAALVAQMDLIVTVDTSVAHLAGAMGKDTWMLLPYVPDWRWFLNRSDSPWYDSVTLFRQTATDDWSNVLATVRKRLAERFS